MLTLAGLLATQVIPGKLLLLREVVDSKLNDLQTADDIRNVIKELKEKYGENLKAGAQGFCWGGLLHCPAARYVLRQHT